MAEGRLPTEACLRTWGGGDAERAVKTGEGDLCSALNTSGGRIVGLPRTVTIGVAVF